MPANPIYTLRGISGDMKQVLIRRSIPFLYNETGLIGNGKVSVAGSDLPLTVGIDPSECLLTLTIGLPVTFVAVDTGIAAQALCHINDTLNAGCFDLHDGTVSVRTALFFRESQLAASALLDLLELCLTLAEVHLNPLKQLSLREITLEQFISTL